jgi:hypothetical protein
MTVLLTLDHAGESGASAGSANCARRSILIVLGLAQLIGCPGRHNGQYATCDCQHDLHVSNADRPWIVTAYSLAFGSLLLLGGRIRDMVDTSER